MNDASSAAAAAAAADRAARMSYGRLIALRSYGAVDLYQRAAGKPSWSAFASTPCSGPRPDEAQGESVAFSADGDSYVTTSEGADPVLHRTAPR